MIPRRSAADEFRRKAAQLGAHAALAIAVGQTNRAYHYAFEAAHLARLALLAEGQTMRSLEA